MPPATLLATKLFAPPGRPGAVQRHRLVARLEAGLQHPLTVVSAPAGFGKSTLASAWATRTNTRVAWLSLESAERDPLRFLAYLIAALRTIEAGVGERALRSLQGPPAPLPSAVATDLLNDLAAGTGRMAVVLDDFQAAASAAVEEVVAFLVDHAPARLHIVVTSRDEPTLPIARWRVKGTVNELGAADLRFTQAEAGAFLNDTMGLTVSGDDAETLERRTEGWIAGLQLAALSLRGRDDVTSFVRSFAGEHRHVLDFLVEEVLRGQSGRVREFLLATSVLDRMCGALCDAVTERDDGAATLVDLERANLFLVPLDDERRWYRYHALFVEAMRAVAERERAEDLPAWHRRASRWLETDGSVGTAIHHARAAGDVDRAALLLERAWRPMDRALMIPTWYRWGRELPEGALRRRPVLANAVAWVRLEAGDLDGADEWLEAAEAWLEARTHEDAEGAAGAHARDVGDELAFRALPARIAAARAYRCQALGDVRAGEAFARQALALAPSDDPGARALPAGLVGLAHWARGELDEALDALQVAATSFRALGDIAAALSFTFGIADIHLARGRLRDAQRTYEDALRDAADQPNPVLPGIAELHVGLAEIVAERGDLQAAETHLRLAETLGPQAVLPGDGGRLAAAMGRVELVLGRADAAHLRLDEAERRWVATPVPETHPVAATRARVWLAQGRLAEARAWAEERLAAGGLEPVYVHDDLLLTLVRVQLAHFRSQGSVAPLDVAHALLDRLLEAAEAHGRLGTVIEARVLQAFARQAADDDVGATAALLAALRPAEAEGHHGVFVGEGPALAGLLRSALRAGAARRQVRRLLADLRASTDRPRVLPDLVEPLSDRERDVLRLLRGDMTGPQVARELGMSVHTLRSHTKAIYAKLGVHGRREAVARADDLDLG